MYIKKELEKYIDDLGSKSPVPGGGSASALSGLLGMALVSMVANFTKTGSKKASVKKLLIKNKELQNKIQLLIDQDVVVFLKLQDALKLPKDAKKRPSITQKCFKDAANVPFDICKLCYEGARLTAEISKIGNPNLISDTGGAIYLLFASFLSAQLNVLINLKYIKDQRFIKTKKDKMLKMSSEIDKIQKQVIKKVKEQMK